MRYIVFIQNESGKDILVGLYNNLNESIINVNEKLKQYGIAIDELAVEEDKTILKYVITNNGIISIRGFEL